MVAHGVTIPKDWIITFCQRYPIRKLALFGSVLRDDFRSDSDIDVLVEFVPGSGVTYLDMVTMQDELASMLGRSVDLVTPGALSKYFRQHVLETAETIYERG
jgi:predicted nucleotidyltransferase